MAGPLYERLLAQRQHLIVPLIPTIDAGRAVSRGWWSARAFSVRWPTRDGRCLVLMATRR